MSAVRLFHTVNGGEIEYAQADLTSVLYDDIKLDTGLETAVYLSWFGGNERDPGLRHDDANPDHSHAVQWWGNIGEPPERQMTSETGHFIRSLPATSNNLLRIEDAATRDLQWMLDTDYSTGVTVDVALVAKNRIDLSARVIIDRQEFAVAFQASWGE